MSSLACFFNVVTCLIVLQTWLVPKGLASSKDDKITSLPGQPSVKFNQYAGYIQVDDKQDRSLFYYFVEAETNPQTKPLVLWFNGGPGCSSLIASFKDRGPFMPKGEVLLQNEFSWNKEANMLFLESPAGVGFSYSSNKSLHNFTNDEITAQDNLKFLFGWLEKYPEYKNRDLFISGVSYAGHYVPQLANLILESRIKPNLKGIALGNPLLKFDVDYNSRANFLWSHGLISDSTYSMSKSICNASQIYRELMHGNLSSACAQVYNQSIQEIGLFVQPNDALIDVCYYPDSDRDTVKPTGDGVDVCVEIEVFKYLNKKNVQEALHAKLVGVDEWSNCNRLFQARLLGTNSPSSRQISEGWCSSYGFSGDQDVLTPFMGTRSLIKAVADDLGLNTTVPYTSWLHNKQVGGWTQVYGDKLSFATVRGGGHDSSFVQPERTFVLFNTFLQGKPLPLPPPRNAP